MSDKIDMVDLKGQYMRIKTEIDAAIREVVESASFINGPAVKRFKEHLEEYSGAAEVIPCANGTDALQICLMSLDLKRGDEVIVPAFTYVASAEVIALLGLVPVMVDVDYDSFNTTAENIERAITPRSKAIIPVHLYGQCCDMERIMELARTHGLKVIEDNAQALGAESLWRNGERHKSGTVADMGATSFFPSKNLGCYGDGGAIFTNDPILAERASMIANHGQKAKYRHSLIGCNSRLDTIQAAILDVKLKYLDQYCSLRREAAHYYTDHLSGVSQIITPAESRFSTHVYHQYTLKIKDGSRDELKRYLESRGIPSMIYYPLPLQEQEAFKEIAVKGESLLTAGRLSEEVLSLPIHTEMNHGVQDLICRSIKEFYGYDQ